MKTTKIKVPSNAGTNEAANLIAALIALGAVWTGDKETAIRKLGSGERWGAGIKDNPAFYEEVKTIVEAHGFSCDVDDSDGIPYLSISAK